MRNKEDLIKRFEVLTKQIMKTGEEAFTEHGIEWVLNDVKAVLYACPEKIANAVLEEVK